jgi:uncharacterized protein (TIGR02246 family)
MRKLIVFCALALVPSAVRASDVHQPTSNVSSIRSDQKNESMIRKLYADFQAAWNRHDAKALGEMWTLDGDHIEPDGTVAKGRDAVTALFAKEHGSVFKGSTLSLTIDDVWFITADVALVDGRYELGGAALPDGTAIPARKGRLSAIFLREGGKWAITASRLMIPTELPYKKPS